MIPDIKNIYFNIDEPFLNKKITKYMMDIYSFYISNQSTRYMNILMVTLEMLIFLYENCKNERKMIKIEKTKDIGVKRGFLRLPQGDWNHKRTDGNNRIVRLFFVWDLSRSVLYPGDAPVKNKNGPEGV